LRSGRPQLTVPFFADQLDNADRAVRLGVARSLTPTHYEAGRVARELRHLLDTPQIAARARQVRAQLLQEDGAAAAADAIAALVSGHPAHHPGAAVLSDLRSDAENCRAAH
jgi:UDP:flavonoid glycosyltransferase YjiC (YdhE family)